jgi:hypothetical protein
MTDVCAFFLSRSGLAQGDVKFKTPLFNAMQLRVSEEIFEMSAGTNDNNLSQANFPTTSSTSSSSSLRSPVSVYKFRRSVRRTLRRFGAGIA